MPAPQPDDLQALLADLAAGKAEAAAELLPLVYEDLREVARGYLRQERVEHTLQPTALVHEVYLRLAKASSQWEGRNHFFAVAAKAMRRVLINHARDRGREKRGGEWDRVTLDNMLDVLESSAVDVLDLDGALTELAALSERQARIVELRVFGGMTIEEVADVLAVGPTTVKADWRMARAWLKRRFFGQDRAEGGPSS